ncbi:hypothetical protein TNCV_3560111 [Trichonephila clavipes]|uniref:Uncharacterized protein n=1 Tax=Trichonephila clavipes TaxID=2585209 RepID=A0A8X6WCR4_TRICX|nr:hypothetical protein TNCV_3560111 [Trichonephila clavipes]
MEKFAVNHNAVDKGLDLSRFKRPPVDVRVEGIEPGAIHFKSVTITIRLRRLKEGVKPIYDRKVRGMLIQPASSQLRPVRGAAVFLENSITVRITEQHKKDGGDQPANLRT